MLPAEHRTIFKNSIKGSRLNLTIMIKKLGFTRLTLIAVFVTQISSCKMSKNLSSGQIITDRVLYIPVTSAAILKQAASKVYALDSLKDNTIVLMKDLHMSFFNRRDTLDFNFDEVTFHFLKDSLIFDEFTFPKWDMQKAIDTMQCRINFRFATPSQPTVRYFEGSFNAVKGIVTSIDTFRVCKYGNQGNWNAF